MKPQILISITDINFLNLRNEIEKLVTRGVTNLHLDIMDTSLVPRISFGYQLVQQISNEFNFDLDLHFMIDLKNNFEILQPYFSNKVKSVIIQNQKIDHESFSQFQKCCHQQQIKVGWSFKTNDNFQKQKEIFSKCDIVQLMGVEPGQANQKFNPKVIERINELNLLMQSENNHFVLQIDGGINQESLLRLQQARVERVVIGRWFINQTCQLQNLN